MMETDQRVMFNGWTLNGSLLAPTHARLKAHAEQIARLNCEQPMVTFKFSPNPSRTLSIHRTFLISAGGPLEALVTAPFSEAITNIVTPDDSFHAFEVLHKFLYCLPIDMSNLPPDMPLVAHRWQIHILFRACFAWAEISQTWNSCLLVEQWMSLLSLLQPPRRFCLFFASVFGSQFDAVAASLEHRDWMWGNNNIWHVFRSRGMLQTVIHTIVRFANADFSELLLDVILSQLEASISDGEAEELLTELDWHTGSCAHALRNAKADRWSARAWRLLALTPNTGLPSDGEYFHMQWAYRRFGVDFRNAPVCETREGYAFNGVSFSMSVQSWCWKDSLSLKLKIREAPQSVLKRFGSRRVSAVVSAMEDSCSCGLYMSSKPGFEEYVAEPWPHFGVTGLTLDCFAKDGGVEYVLMDPREFEAWRTRHQDCGLLVSARLRVFDEEVGDQKGESPNSSERRKCMSTEIRTNWSVSRWHASCPCVRCRIERRTRGDHGPSSLRYGNVDVRHDHPELRLLSHS